ncbi:dihydrofolate reductase [Oricola sp.]|uniref:dihydrofolate reductase n=1 Tax=Oricola sp. TaxID=1979950 RepID=UPI003510EA5E
MQPVLSVIAAVSRNGVIGRDGDMPWRLSSDLKRFKALTMGAPIIMGRKTFESIGKPLPGRLNIVVTRNYDWAADGAMRVGSLDAALELATAHLESAEPDAEDPDAELPDEVFVIGGGEIYAQAMGMADTLYITEVLAEIEGDTHFPEIDPAVWEEVETEDVPAGEKDSHPTRFVVHERRTESN